MEEEFESEEVKEARRQLRFAFGRETSGATATIIERFIDAKLNNRISFKRGYRSEGVGV